MTQDHPEQSPGKTHLDSRQNTKLVTLERLQKIARFLTPLKWVALFAMALSVVTFIFSVIEAGRDYYLIPSVVGAMWAMLLFAFIIGFQVIPDRAPANGSFTERMTAQITRASYWILAILTGTASLTALILTFRLLVIWSSEHN